MTVRQQFRDHLYTHADAQGFQAPTLLMEYLVDLLSQRLTQTEIIPHPSFAERYLQLYSSSRVGDIREFADSSLFFVSLMPSYGLRRGLTMDYYAALGISAYYTYGDVVHDPRFTELGNWFYYLQRFLASALHPDQHTDFWAMVTKDKY